MPVFKPRNRLVNFRLSEEEFEKLRASCSLNGARSLSDFARVAVMRSVAGASSGSECSEGPPPVRVAEIDRKVSNLETRVVELVSLIEQLKQDTQSVPAQPSIGGMKQ